MQVELGYNFAYWQTVSYRVHNNFCKLTKKLNVALSNRVAQSDFCDVFQVWILCCCREICTLKLAQIILTYQFLCLYNHNLACLVAKIDTDLGNYFYCVKDFTDVHVIQAFLANEDLGDSLDTVEALIKKHEDFEKSLAAQEEKINVSILTRGFFV